MTLGNMRANGVRSLLVYCSACREAVPVPAFGPRMVCTGCGMIGADARPNWRERYDPAKSRAGTKESAAGAVADTAALVLDERVEVVAADAARAAAAVQVCERSLRRGATSERTGWHAGRAM